MIDYDWLCDAVKDEISCYDHLSMLKFNEATADFGRYATLQLNGCELVICENGRWFMNDTSGA